MSRLWYALLPSVCSSRARWRNTSSSGSAWGNLGGGGVDLRGAFPCCQALRGREAGRANPSGTARGK